MIAPRLLRPPAAGLRGRLPTRRDQAGQMRFSAGRRPGTRSAGDLAGGDRRPGAAGVRHRLLLGRDGGLAGGLPLQGLAAAAGYYGRRISELVDETPQAPDHPALRQDRRLDPAGAGRRDPRRPSRTCRSTSTTPATASSPTAAPTTTPTPPASPACAPWRTSSPATAAGAARSSRRLTAPRSAAAPPAALQRPDQDRLGGQDADAGGVGGEDVGPIAAPSRPPRPSASR